MGAEPSARSRALAAGALAVTTLLGAAWGCGGGQQTESAEEREAREAALIRQQLHDSWTPPVLLWRVTVGVGESTPSWVMAALPYGATLHDALPAPHDAILDRTTHVVAEVDPGALELPALYESYRLSRRDRLDRLLGAGAWAELRTELGQLLPEATLRTIRPWVLALHVSRIRMAEAEADADQRRRVAGAASTSSVTSELIEFARTRGTETEWLDADPTTYIADYEAIEQAHWVLTLRDELESMDAARARMEHLRTAFASRDESQVRAACAEVNANDPEATLQAHTLIGVRAQRWLPEVERQLRRGGALVAIDACTLLADNGVLALLYGTGLRIQRLGAPPGTERP
ncbi:MAG: TraB/GumN family protein [Sandaracinaceae bacterium]|nr:TraB/GumN family protein [Sandaracinaceae bacterium]